MDLVSNVLHHALINITENITKARDNGTISCGVFVDIQKAFDIVDHQILLEDWFKSYLSNRDQYVSMSGYDSDLAAINCVVRQGSVLVF